MPLYPAVTMGLNLPIKYGLGRIDQYEHILHRAHDYQNAHARRFLNFNATFDQIQPDSRSPDKRRTRRSNCWMTLLIPTMRSSRV